MAHGHHIEIHQEQFIVPAKAKTFAIVMMVIGLILSGIGLATMDRSETAGHNSHTTTENAKPQVHKADEHATAASTTEHHGNVENETFGPRAMFHQQAKPWMTQVWSSLLVIGYFLLIISLAALFFIAVQYIANAGWSAAIKRIPEAMYTFIPVAFTLVFLVILVAKNDLFHWVHYEHQHIAKGAEGYDRILAEKAWFLNTPMLVVLPLVLVVIWILMGRKLRSLSTAEDSAEKGDTTFFRKSIRWSAGFAVVYGFTISVVAWLYIMSIDAHWFSTIFGVYNFATGWVTALTIITLFVIYLKTQGFLKLVTDEHIHDLAKFMFAFSIFWGYIWISQYLLIWYAHLPEEMSYYQIRFEEYKPYFLVNVIMNFLCPFLILMMRNAKRNKMILAIAGAIMISGHYLDIWLMVMPGVFGPGKHIGLFDVGTMLLFGGVFVYWVLIALTKRGLVAINHPYIEESANHDVGI